MAVNIDSRIDNNQISLDYCKRHSEYCVYPKGKMKTRTFLKIRCFQKPKKFQDLIDNVSNSEKYNTESNGYASMTLKNITFQGT